MPSSWKVHWPACVFLRVYLFEIVAGVPSSWKGRVSYFDFQTRLTMRANSNKISVRFGVTRIEKKTNKGKQAGHVPRSVAPTFKLCSFDYATESTPGCKNWTARRTQHEKRVTNVRDQTLVRTKGKKGKPDHNFTFLRPRRVVNMPGGFSFLFL